MGEWNNVLNAYMNKSERIRSIIEYFWGEKLPKEWVEHCVDAEEFYTVKDKKGRISFRQRDIFKKINLQGHKYFLGIENQTGINLIFPWRLMQMDCLAYERQIEMIQQRNLDQKVKYSAEDDYKYRYREEDCLEPVVNLVLYWGRKKWKKPLDMKDMMNFSDVPENIKALVENYKIHLIDMRAIPEQALNKMDSDVKYVLGLMKCTESGKRYEEYIGQHRDYFSRIPKSAVDVLDVCMNIKSLKAALEYVKLSDSEEEEADMCKALKEIEKNARDEGRRIGVEQGIEQGKHCILSLIQKMLESGEGNLIAKLSEEPDFLESMCVKYQI